MLNFHRINSVNDPYFSKLFNLYTLAFPPSERRSWAAMEYELSYEKRFYAHALIQDDLFVGLFNYWTFDRFFYIEHLAVSPKLRSRGIGSEAMKVFMSQVKLPVVLEVELPNDMVASRRLHFYERLGFTILSHSYAQPPYEGNGFFMPELIMSNDIHFANSHFEMIKETLYDQVYHYEHSIDKNTVMED
ncbi:MAG: GNAT family N-acetyltransferase [Bacteroidota bacterium]|nr:GNAT family N-acetyltransferase [Bacteroidota bacterium]